MHTPTIFIRHFAFRAYSSCVKSVCIRRFSVPQFPTFELNTEIYRVNLRIQSACGKMRKRKTPNTNTFYAVCHGKFSSSLDLPNKFIFGEWRPFIVFRAPKTLQNALLWWGEVICLWSVSKQLLLSRMSLVQLEYYFTGATFCHFDSTNLF